MAITEEKRHRLYQRLEGVLGPEEAATLMEHLPPVGWADVATKRDVDGLTRDIERLSRDSKRDIEDLSARTKLNIDGLARDIDRVRSDIELRVQASESGVRADIASLRAELHAEMRKLVVVTAGMLTTFSAVAIAAAGLW